MLLYEGLSRLSTPRLIDWLILVLQRLFFFYENLSVTKRRCQPPEKFFLILRFQFPIHCLNLLDRRMQSSNQQRRGIMSDYATVMHVCLYDTPLTLLILCMQIDLTLDSNGRWTDEVVLFQWKLINFEKYLAEVCYFVIYNTKKEIPERSECVQTLKIVFLLCLSGLSWNILIKGNPGGEEEMTELKQKISLISIVFSSTAVY